jgi:hypothetical protein
MARVNPTLYDEFLIKSITYDDRSVKNTFLPTYTKTLTDLVFDS